MKLWLLITILFCTCFSKHAVAQLTLFCPNYTTIGTDTSFFYSPTSDPLCALCGTGQNDIPWTGSTCSGTLVSTVTGGAVTELTLAYTSVNLDDYATVTIDGGGSMSIMGTHVGVNGNVIGPYNCSGSFGDIFITVTSTLPFTTVTVQNTGCSSGWVIQCPGSISYAGEDTTITVCDTLISLPSLIPPGSNSGTWTEATSSGQFNSVNNEFTSTGLSGGTYIFQYLVNSCGPIDIATATIIVAEDSICNPVIPPPIDSIPNVGPFNVFTPNDDGVNDNWYIYELENYPLNEVQIYNRWGDEVRHFSNYDNDIIIWDGTSTNGKELPTGTYYFIINATGVVNKSGWVQLVR